MNEDDLKNLIDTTRPPEPSEMAKARAKKAAMEAYRESFEKSEKNSQGIDDQPRPTGNNPPETRSQPMDMQVKEEKVVSFTRKKMVISSIAASMTLAVGLMVYKNIPHDMGEPKILDQTYQLGKLGEEIAGTPPGTTIEVTEGKKQDHVTRDYNAQLAASRSEADRAREFQKESFADGIASNAPAEIMAEAEMPASYAATAPAKQKIAKTENVSRKLAAAPASPMVASMGADAMPPVHEPRVDRDRFEHVDESPIKRVSEAPVSTFSIDVDTASYSYVRRQLNNGVLPAEDAVRVEEMVNYFDYAYPTPASRDVPFATHVHVMDSPWREGNQLVHIGIKGYEVSKQQQPDSNLVFLLDVSGSMNSPDKLPLVKQSMGLLLDSLKPTDKVSIVVYAGAAGAVLEPTEVKDKQKILGALNRLNAGGSTAGGQGLALAYQLAEMNFDKNAVNRIILATDGDFNVGVTQDERLEDFVERKRESGIYLSVFGFGQGNYQDALMQKLAQNGNGVAAYIDTLSEAQKILVDEATSALFPIANDVKIQIEFNPAKVEEYRLVGYETRALNREDFNNDKVDAGDIGAGHTVTAIYEITPAGSQAAMIQDSRYQPEATVDNPSNEIAFLKLRYKLPGEKTSQLIETPVYETLLEEEAGSTIQQEVDFSVAVAGFAQLLKGGKYTGALDYDAVINQAQASKGADNFGYRTEFIQLVRKAKIAGQKM